MRTAILAILIAFTASAATAAEKITVFAAASLTEALTRIATDFETATGHDVTLSFGSSAALARQIRAGAPADIYLSAHPEWMDFLGSDILADTRRDLLGNRLVMVAPAPSDPVALTADAMLPLLRNGPLAMGMLDAVPAGIYGRAAFEHLDLWRSIVFDVAQTANVRAALALVALGEAPLGVVYATDALAEPRVSVVATFDPETHPPIRYPVAALNDRPVTRAFMAHLLDARPTFEASGYEVLP